MRYRLSRSGGAIAMATEIDTLAEAVEFARMALDDEDEVVLEDQVTGESWVNQAILGLDSLD